MKKILLIFGIILTLVSCGPLRVEKLKITFLDGHVDTITLRYRGKLSISSGGNLYDNSSTLLLSVKSYSIIK